jgi:Fe2+ or Zn2+ uptake regulation protein
MKRVAQTSRASLRDLGASLTSRRLAVLSALRTFRATEGYAPTAYELLRWMRHDNAHLDLNSVRPRLTELKDTGRVTTADKRQCLVTGKRVYTWTAASPRRSVPNDEPLVDTVPVQSELFR